MTTALWTIAVFVAMAYLSRGRKQRETDGDARAADDAAQRSGGRRTE